MASVTELPFFEGDYWPNVIEECIKEVDNEEAERRREAEAQAAAGAAAEDVDDDADEVSTLKKIGWDRSSVMMRK